MDRLRASIGDDAQAFCTMRDLVQAIFFKAHVAETPGLMAAQTPPDDRPECATCGKRLDDWRFNCVCCDAMVCDDCPMHENPRDRGEGICNKCGPDAWRRL